MRIYRLTDDELAGFPPETLTNITVATGGEGGAPELPDVLAGAELALAVTPQSAAYASTRQPIVASRSLRLEFWAFFDFDTSDADYWGATTSGLQVNVRTKFGAVERCCFRSVKKTNTTIDWRVDYYDNNGENIKYNTASMLGGWSYDLANPHWLKFVIKWQAESAPGAGDGVVGLKIYDDDGETLRAQLADITDATTGHDPIQSVVVFALARAVAQTSYVADLQIYDTLEGEEPGVLCPFIHSYDRDRGLVRVRAVCDRPVRARLTYGETGTECDAAAVPLAYDDGGHWAEFALEVHPDTTYKYQFHLADAADETNTATVSAIADDACEFMIPGKTAVNTFFVGDYHSTVYEPYYMRRAMMDRTGRGRPNMIVMLGDMVCRENRTLNVPAARLEFGAFYGAWRGMLATALSLHVQGNHEAFPSYDWTGDAKTHLHNWHPIVGASPVRFARQRVGSVEFIQVDTDIMLPAAFVAVVENDIVPAIERASDVAHIVFCNHHYGINYDEVNSAHKASRGRSWDESNWGTVHAALRECRRRGQTVSWWHGHVHGGSYWIKDGVVYTAAPNQLRGSPKNTGYGNYLTSAGGDPGSAPKSFWGANGEAGTNGYGWCVFSRGAMRAALMDVKTNATMPVVQTHQRVLDRTSLVPLPDTANDTGTVTLSFLGDLQSGDAVRIVTRNKWNRIRDVRRYQWADMLIGREVPAWGHVGLENYDSWDASISGQTLVQEADTTATTIELDETFTRPAITLNPGYEWVEVESYNTITGEPIPDRIAVEWS